MAGKRQKPPDELVYRRGGRVKPLVPVASAHLAPRLPNLRTLSGRENRLHTGEVRHDPGFRLDLVGQRDGQEQCERHIVRRFDDHELDVIRSSLVVLADCDAVLGSHLFQVIEGAASSLHDFRVETRTIVNIMSQRYV